MLTRSVTSCLPRPSIRITNSLSFFVFAIILAALGNFVAGCGSTSASMTPPPPATPASVPIIVSSTANGQLSEFDLTLQSLTLTNKGGTSVTVISSPQKIEFIHSNATAAPLITATIPLDTYVSATASIGNSSFTCETLDSSGGLVVSIFAYGFTPSSQVTVNLPSPITVGSEPMGLTLDLLASQSASFSQCNPNSAIEQYTISPTFNLTSLPITSQPTSPKNGKETAIRGRVSSLAANGESFTIVTPQPEQLTLTINSGTSTIFQGISDFQSLAIGAFVDMDIATQSDGSLLATRIAVFDQTATNVMAGPLNFVDELVPALTVLGRQQQGDDYTAQPTESQYYSFPSSTVFQISSQFTNIQNLPFPASFSPSNMVPGQHVAIFSKAISDNGSYPYTSATTITLLPQTINGSITSVSGQGRFSIYTVALAPYDLFPQLAVQPGQASLLQNPSQVQVYVDSSATLLLQTNTLAPGDVFRFTGLVFNDRGTLRMDCAQVSDGVAQ